MVLFHRCRRLHCWPYRAACQCTQGVCNNHPARSPGWVLRPDQGHWAGVVAVERTGRCQSRGAGQPVRWHEGAHAQVRPDGQLPEYGPAIGSEDAATRRNSRLIIFEATFEGIFRHGFFNGDPHPGNFLFRDNSDVVFL
ncbi:MAG: AarF/UbiB family protein, partial [Pseudomonadota bacterium]